VSTACTHGIHNRRNSGGGRGVGLTFWRLPADRLDRLKLAHLKFDLRATEWADTDCKLKEKLNFSWIHKNC